MNIYSYTSFCCGLFRSAYNLFYQCARKQLLLEFNELSGKDIPSICSELWRNLPASERALWQADAENDRLRYQRECLQLTQQENNSPSSSSLLLLSASSTTPPSSTHSLSQNQNLEDEKLIIEASNDGSSSTSSSGTEENKTKITRTPPRRKYSKPARKNNNGGSITEAKEQYMIKIKLPKQKQTNMNKSIKSMNKGMNTSKKKSNGNNFQNNISQNNGHNVSSIANNISINGLTNKNDNIFILSNNDDDFDDGRVNNNNTNTHHTTTTTTKNNNYHHYNNGKNILHYINDHDSNEPLTTFSDEFCVSASKLTSHDNLVSFLNSTLDNDELPTLPNLHSQESIFNDHLTYDSSFFLDHDPFQVDLDLFPSLGSPSGKSADSKHYQDDVSLFGHDSLSNFML